MNEIRPAMVIFFVENPQLLELEVERLPWTRLAAEHIRAKIGLEFLELESRARVAEEWVLRFAGPKHPRYQMGLQPAFVATVAKESLTDRSTGWRLKRVSWRRD